MTKRKWLRIILTGVAFLALASFGFSRALHGRGARRFLIDRLAASFGRPVDVSSFDFSLLDGARIEANSVTVSDDPHFSNEYFLRADTLTAGVRWRALFAGRFEFGTVSLTRPSLNLVRDAQGHWNFESWLPPASQSGARPGFVGPVAPLGTPLRPAQIDVNGGRINFKQGDNKIQFALVDVAGRVQQNSAGRWQLDLEAHPMRAGTELQDIGTLRLRGSIAGTSARLQPADLNLTWRAASLADTLRLVRQNDYGMRGQLAVDLNARIAQPEISVARGANSSGAQWSVSAVARLTGLHGWRLPERDTDPAANLSLEMNWRPGEAHAEIRKLLLEMPASRLQGTGGLDWARGIHPQFHMEGSTLALADVLSVYRAVQPEVADDLRVDCTLGLDLKLDGWPLELQQGAISSSGGTLAAKSLPAPLRMGATRAVVSRGGIDLPPTEISIASVPSVQPEKNPEADEARNSFLVRGSVAPEMNGAFRWPPDWNFSVEGRTSRLQDLLAISAALATPVNSSWAAVGGVAVKMRGSHRAGSADPPWLGTMDFLDLSLNPTYINQPVRLAKAHVEYASQQRTITLGDAEAFGAVWHGSIVRKILDKQWTFDLTADRLDAAELDRWLGPRARPAGFLSRFTGSNSPAAPTVSGPDSVVTRIAARGRLRAGTIDMPPMHIEQFDGQAELDGRTIRIRKAQGDFFGGKVSGSFDAQLVPDPSYEFQARFDRVDLSRLAQTVPYFSRAVGGGVSATLTLSAHGVGRQDLVDSMQGEGTLNGRNILVAGLNLSSLFSTEDPDASAELFPTVQGSYRIQAREIDLSNFELDHSRGRLQVEGRIDFSHALNIRVRPSILQAATDPLSALPPGFLLGGTIEAPKLVVPPAATKQAARAGR